MSKNKKRKKVESEYMPERGTAEYFAIRSRNARNNAGLFLVFTVVNILLLLGKVSRGSFLFSAWVPYWQAASRVFADAGVEGIAGGSMVLAFGLCGLLALVWLLWKKHWLVSVVFALLALGDTVYMVIWVIQFHASISAWNWTFDLVLTLIYHIMVLYYAWTGVEAGWNLKK